MRWIDLVPSDFERIRKQSGICVVPMGSLERHGEHLPFGCDVVVAETIAAKAAELEPCVVFPGYFLAQVHEAACFPGTVNLPQALAVEVLSKVLDGIAANGFDKIVLYNSHGGNNAFLEYFAMSRIDVPRDYSLYIIGGRGALTDEEKRQLDGLWQTKPLAHACEMETSVYMACKPGVAKLELCSDEPHEPLRRMEHLTKLGIYNAHWWYADYPQNVVGCPSAASEEKGKVALELLVRSTARALKAIREDTTVPALQREFLEKMKNRGL